MAAVVCSAAADRQQELLLVRLQADELQAELDRLLAERLALALCVGEEATLEAVLGSSVPSEADDDVSVLKTQLDELKAQESQILAVALAEKSAVEDTASRELVNTLQAQAQWAESVKRHDEAFARKLASVDAETWELYGDELCEPMQLPPFPTERPARPAEQPGFPLGCAAVPMPSRPTPTRRSSSQPSATSAQSKVPQNIREDDGKGPVAQAAGAGRSVDMGVAAEFVTRECSCCFEELPADQLCCAGADAPSSSSAPAGCGHLFCEPCMREYVVGAVRDRRYPVPCPMSGSGCKVQLSHNAAASLLQNDAKSLQVLGALAAEQSIPEGLRVYCPHKDCSCLLDRPEDVPTDSPVTCPACSRPFCLACRIPGWHEGLTCAQFQALPADQRTAEDAALLRLSAAKQWKQCPCCRLTVERTEGCNHVKCRCGADFCYACGSKYKDSQPTANNVHGTPSCECPLFDVPGEEGRQPRAAPAVQPPAVQAVDPAALDMPVVPVQPQRPRCQGVAQQAPVWGGGAPGVVAERPVRNGRKVSRTPCIHADSIYDCPKGQRCWFRHEEDGIWW